MTPGLSAAAPAPDGDLQRLVRRAYECRDSLPGTAGFAGALATPARMNTEDLLVRDVLGRVPLFVDAERNGWAHDPRPLDAPVRVPAGHAVDRSASDSRRDEDTDVGPGGQQVWTLPEPPAADDAAGAVEAVRAAVERSVAAVDSDGLAVAFSGGVDSAVVAAGAPDAPCYVAGFEGAHDITAAREAAAAMDRDLRVVEFAHADLERAVPAVVAATGRTNAMDVAIAVPLYLVAERVAADGFDRLAVGQGADELFGGYAKVADPAGDDRVAAETVRGARRETVLGLPAQLERDSLTIRAAGVEPVAPLLHDRVVRTALPLSGELLATGDRRKIALRAAAAGVVPEAVVGAEKKALQYGTYAARELDRLARRNGFKRRLDDHVDRYVESLVADVDVPTVRG